MENFLVDGGSSVRSRSAGMLSVGDTLGLKEAQDRLAAKAEESLLKYKKDTDYYVGQVLYCGVCKTPKSMLVDKPGGGKRLVGVDCACVARERMEAEEQVIFDSWQKNDAKFKANFMGDDVLSGCDFDKWDLDAVSPKFRSENSRLRSRLMAFVDKFEEVRKMHKGLYLFGGLGVGKTFAAACVANALSKKRYRCVVTNFNRIINSTWTRENRQDILDELNMYDLLVVDDLGTEFDSKFVQSLVFEIIDNRYRMGLPLLVTSNIPFNMLQNTKSEMLRRAYSRLLEMCHPLEVFGDDRRAARSHKEQVDFLAFLDN